MPVTITHAFVSPIPDLNEARQGVVRPSHWNDAHSVVGITELADANPASAATDGATEASSEIQAWLDGNELAGRSSFLPTAKGQRYHIGTKITSEKLNLSIIGDTGPTRQATDIGGYLTGPATGIDCLLDWGNGQAIGTGALHLEKLPFYRATIADYPAIRVTIDSNGPSRGMTLRDVSCRGFTALIELEAPTVTAGWLSAANLTLENCNVLGCTYSVHAVDRVLGARIVGNQLEQGAAIHGLLDGPVTIADNMLEGQADAIRIHDVSHSKLYLARNYFEAQTGDYAVSFEAVNRNAEITIDENYGWNLSANTCTDLIRLVGQGKLRFLPGSLVLAANRHQLVTLKGWLGYMADFNGQGFLAYADVQNAFYAPLNPRYAARSTTGWTVDKTLGAVTVTTPYGETTTARQQTGFAATYSDIAETPTTGDLVVLCALLRVDRHTSLATAWASTTSYTANDVVSSGGKNWTALSTHTSGADFETDFLAGKWLEQTTIPAIYLYNSAFSASLVMSSGVEWPNDADGQWLLYVSCVPATFTEATTLKLRFGANGTSASSNHTITIAAVATKVVAAADFDGEGRVSVDHLIPW